VQGEPNHRKLAGKIGWWSVAEKGPLSAGPGRTRRRRAEPLLSIDRRNDGVKRGGADSGCVRQARAWELLPRPVRGWRIPKDHGEFPGCRSTRYAIYAELGIGAACSGQAVAEEPGPLPLWMAGRVITRVWLRAADNGPGLRPTPQ